MGQKCEIWEGINCENVGRWFYGKERRVRDKFCYQAGSATEFL